VYFWLPAALESVSAREVGKLALFALLSAAIDRDRQEPGAASRKCYLFIDEFQRLAGDNFRIILEQARSFGIGAILANQTTSDLKAPDTDLRPTVQTNTRVKMYFSIQDASEAKAISDISGEEIALRMGQSFTEDLTSFVRRGPSSTTVNISETLKPRLTITDIRRASDHPNRFVLLVSRGSGLSQFGGLPFIASADFAMPFEAYARLRRLPLPQAPGVEAPESAPSVPSAAEYGATVTNAGAPADADAFAARQSRERRAQHQRALAEEKRLKEGRPRPEPI